MSHYIELKEVSKIYNENCPNAFTALKDISLEIEKNEFVSIMGKSGSGKSTLINILSGSLSATSGQVLIDQTSIQDLNDEELSKFVREKIGYVYQENSMLDTLTIMENILLKVEVDKKNQKEWIEKVYALAKELDIDAILNFYPYECSSGQVKRAAIIQTILSHPLFVIGDEPTGNLDRQSAKQVMSYLQKLNQLDTTILLVTHDPLIASYSNKVYFLDEGKLVNKIEKRENQSDFYEQIVEYVSRGDHYE